jgi:hypothetical protein
MVFGSLKSAINISISVLPVALFISDFTIDNFSEFLPSRISRQLYLANSNAVALPIAPVAPVIKTIISFYVKF